MGRGDESSTHKQAKLLRTSSGAWGSQRVEASTKASSTSIEIDLPLADLSIDDFRSLVRLSTARMACFDLRAPVSTNLTRAEFISSFYRSGAVLVEASEAFASHFGQGSVETTFGRTLNELLPHKLGFGELFGAWFDRGLSRATFDIQITAQEIGQRVLQVVAYPTIRGEFIHRVWLIIRDISEHAHSVARLAHAERHYRTLVERPGLVLGRILLNETAEYFSPSLEEMVGISIESLKQTPSLLIQFAHPEDLTRIEQLFAARASGLLRPVDTEIRFRLKDGEYHAFYVRQSPMVSENGFVEFYDFVAIDVQHHKELELEVQRNARVSLVGQLAAGISHDFNNYLTAIIGQLDSALLHLRHDSIALDAVSAAKKGAEACAQVSTQLLNIGKGKSTPPQELELNEIVHEVCTLVSRVIPHHIALRILTSHKPLVTVGERVQLQQVLINLILNARDAMPQGGVLTVAVTPTEPGDTFPDLTTEPPHAESKPAVFQNSSPENAVAACITVSDTGAGMSEDTMKNIFRPFFTTKSRQGGTGLGLSMVKMIVEAHQGWLDISSVESAGTAISVYLPLSCQYCSTSVSENAGPSLTSLKTPLSIAAHSIAIAEDDELIRSMLSATLTSMGCTVATFENGLSLIEHLSSHDATCDFILIDDSMPRARGVELLAQVRRLQPSANMVLTSGDPSVAHDPSLQKFDVKFLAKPFPIADLVSLIDDQQK